MSFSHKESVNVVVFPFSFTGSCVQNFRKFFQFLKNQNDFSLYHVSVVTILLQEKTATNLEDLAGGGGGGTEYFPSLKAIESI